MNSYGQNRGMKRKANVLLERPKEVGIMQYAQSRANEIEALAIEIKKNTGARKVFQSLPIHMRRRAMSHNIKRLPRRLHNIARKEYDKITSNPKRPSRRHRRRPKNLLEEYQRRQRKHIWLETHIWHAKRFKMEDRWGYRIPLHSTDKSIKACYRATQNYCQIQDMSYLCCIEITGEENNILEGLGHLTDLATGLTFGARSNINGTREGHTCVYKYDKYPFHAIGCVSYLWKPETNQDESNLISRQLWIWCHPSCYNELWEELKICFKPENRDSDISELHQQTFSSGEITVISLKDTLNRHRLIGPSSNQILYQVLKPANILKKEASEQWWQKYYQIPSKSLAYTQQGEFIESLDKTPSPGEYTPYSVIGVTVGDPRISRPDRKTKVTKIKDVDTDNTLCYDKLVPDVSMSALWNSDIRQEVKATKMSDQKLNELKSDIMIPGSLADLGIEESRVPIILVQRPGTSGNYGSGWDVILPQNWSMAFWLTFIYHGARAAGSRDLESLAFEQSTTYYPNDYPDTSAGSIHEQKSAEKLKNKFDKRPPAKRCNYVKLGIAAPFLYPWRDLTSSWNDGRIEHIYVLRDRKCLKVLSQMFNANNTSINQQYPNKQWQKTIHRKLEITKESVFKEHKSSLVHVELTMLLRGVPDEHAMICIPVDKDIELLQKDKTYSGPKEPVHKDKNKTQKQKNMTQSLTKLKSVDSASCMRKSCCREIIGFVNHGGFSLGSGNGRGQGFCTTKGLQYLSQHTSPFYVLVRNPSSYQYRFAYINII
ncbi:ribonucleases P/MRP protein subunit POP1-like isoform X2 [Mytilus galloprovincialis]|uniref:ribonucleases P/MRP protein subunit POP1-like isoform X2 n=1 Tax=Mytilus galloprovincialis TaxID=29158 RepID=UPI003F7B7674